MSFMSHIQNTDMYIREVTKKFWYLELIFFLKPHLSPVVLKIARAVAYISGLEPRSEIWIKKPDFDSFYFDLATLVAVIGRFTKIIRQVKTHFPRIYSKIGGNRSNFPFY